MRRRIAMIMGLLAVFVLLPMAAFAADDPAEESVIQEKVFVDESHASYGGANVTNDNKLSDIIDEINRNSEFERTLSDPQRTAPEGVKAHAYVTGNSTNYQNYTYKITPLLPPFNEYFFVETSNPDPKSFRFADKTSKYSDSATISWDWDSWDEVPNLYADIQFDNTKTARVNGGYIFHSYDTDGGQVVLQGTDNPNDWTPTWKDTTIKVTLPALEDDTDYLIDTYATENSFFDNMDAVQQGFSSICLYSGSFVRGTLTKTEEYWSAAIAGHLDQSFYIYSPYDREGSRSLFASAIYPFRYDSLGFPSMMANVAERLDSSATYKWDDYSHYLINVTYNGETRSYGGAGNGEGQGISEDKILQQFTFGTGGTTISLTSIYGLLKQYAAIDMPDDIPRDDALTWEQIYNTVGDGAWSRVKGGSSQVYEFFFQDGDGTHFVAEEWGIGYSIYWGGDLHYACDAWVDGRYVCNWRYYVPGETFEDHPTSTIILMDYTVPQISYTSSYSYNQETSQYEKNYQVTGISEEPKTVVFGYNDDGKWTASYSAFNDDCAYYDQIEEMTEQGLIDAQYLDMVTITPDEIEGLNVDGNTNAAPDKGYIFDGSAAPGTEYDHAQGHCWNWGETTEMPTCTEPGEKLFTCLVCGDTKTETVPAAGHEKPLKHVAATPATCIDVGNCEYWYCPMCWTCFSDKDGKHVIDEYDCYIWDGDHKWKHYKIAAGLLKNGSEYDQCTVCKEKKNVKKLKGYATFYVKNFKLAPAKAAFTAKWTKRGAAVQKKFNGYQIRYSTKSNMKGAKYATASKKSASKKITKLKKKTKYYVQVRTYTISKNVKYYSKWSTKKAVKTK